VPLHEAVRDAQARGYAEADACKDLFGRNAAGRHRILARHAFGREVDAMSVEGMQEDRSQHLLSDVIPGRQLRFVGTASKRNSGKVVVRVCLEWIGKDHPLANITDEWNALAITLTSGETIVVTGRGAGRWPTTEAVIADLLELRRNAN
jgi:homoserine dehydrogenase